MGGHTGAAPERADKRPVRPHAGRKGSQMQRSCCAQKLTCAQHPLQCVRGLRDWSRSWKLRGRAHRRSGREQPR